MTNQHPITPPPELVEQWKRSGPADAAVNNAYERHIATCAAQWGADIELEDCCQWLDDYLLAPKSAQLRAARRPQPPSLKEQALALVEQHEDGWRPSPKDWDTLRRALEQLPDNE